jgi:hypothetical protein
MTSFRFTGDEHADFSTAETEALGVWLLNEFGTRPARRHDAVLAVQGAEPERLGTGELEAWLRSNGLGRIARDVKRQAVGVPRGHVLVVVVGEEGVRLRDVKVDDFASSPTPPAWARTSEGTTDERMPTPPSAIDGTYAPGEPWRRHRWVGPLPGGRR